MWRGGGWESGGGGLLGMCRWVERGGERRENWERLQGDSPTASAQDSQRRLRRDDEIPGVAGQAFLDYAMDNRFQLLGDEDAFYAVLQRDVRMSGLYR